MVADRHCSFKGSLVLVETCITKAFFTFSSWLLQLVTLVGRLALQKRRKKGTSKGAIMECHAVCENILFMQSPKISKIAENNFWKNFFALLRYQYLLQAETQKITL